MLELRFVAELMKAIHNSFTLSVSAYADANTSRLSILREVNNELEIASHFSMPVRRVAESCNFVIGKRWSRLDKVFVIDIPQYHDGLLCV